MSQLYVGLDVSQENTALCIVDKMGKTLIEMTVPTAPASIALALKPYRRLLEKVGHETGPLSSWLHKELKKRRLPVLCLDARRTRAALAAQRNKTDRNDAHDIAALLARGFAADTLVKSDEAQRHRAMLRARSALKAKARDLENTARDILKAFGIRNRKLGSGVDPLLKGCVEAMLRGRAALLDEVKHLDQIIRQIAKSDPVCRRLMTTPGVGPLIALAFKSAVDDPYRFTTSRLVAAYFGLTPRRFQSGKTDFQGRISKRGDFEVRAALYLAGHSILTRSKRNTALRTWALRLKHKKGHRFACVACARKLAVILHRMWLTGTDFQAHHQTV